jgi:hypothetical protein
MAMISPYSEIISLVRHNVNLPEDQASKIQWKGDFLEIETKKIFVSMTTFILIVPS